MPDIIPASFLDRASDAIVDTLLLADDPLSWPATPLDGPAADGPAADTAPAPEAHAAGAADAADVRPALTAGLPETNEDASSPAVDAAGDDDAADDHPVVAGGAPAPAEPAPGPAPAPAPAPAGNDVHVSTLAELNAALASATPGTTILLASGHYGDLSISNRHFADYVTIRSADGDGGAVFGGITASSVSYLRFDDVTVDRPMRGGDASWTKAVSIGGSHHIQFLNNEIRGSVDGNYDNDLYGMGVFSSSEVLVEGNEFHDLFRGAIFGQSDAVVVRENHIYHNRAEGLNFGAPLVNLVVENNFIERFFPNFAEGDHPDMIQFWNNGSNIPSENILIRGNVLIEGPGGDTQAIFFGDETNAKYKNVLIENNIVYNSAPQGIWVEGADGIIVRNNTVLQTVGGSSRILVRGTDDGIPSTNVKVYNNVAVSVGTEGVGDVYNNYFVQWSDPRKDNHYDRLFLDALTNDEVTIQDLFMFPGSPIDFGSGLGAEARFAELQKPVAYISVESRQGTLDALRVAFSASDYDLLDGVPLGAEATFSWDFGDGTGATGPNVIHEYQAGGEYRIELTILNNGVEHHVDHSLFLKNPLLVDLKLEGSLENSGGVKGTFAWNASPSYVSGPSGLAANFDVSTGFVILSGAGSELSGMSELTVSFDFCAESTARARPLWLHTAYGIEFYNSKINGPGGVSAILQQAFDGQWHHLSTILDSFSGTSKIYFDGALVATKTGILGPINLASGSDLTIGSDPWGKKFDGQIDNVRIYTGVVPPDQEEAIYQRLTGGAAPPVNRAPTDLHLDHSAVDEGAADGTTIGILTASDPDTGDGVTFSLIDTAGGRFAVDRETGRLTVADGGLLDFETAARHTVVARATDAGGLAHEEAFTITLNNVNDRPIAAADVATTAEDTQVVIAVLANDSDADGTLVASSVAVATGPAHGTAVKNANGTITYTPSANFAGTDSFTYTVADNQGLVSAPATVTVTVTPVNDDAAPPSSRVLADAVLWLDAADKSTLLDGDGDSLLTGTGGAGNGFGGGVRTWADKSDAGNDAVQTAASARPTVVVDDAKHNGLTVLKFDGFDDEFLLNQHINNTNTTIFAVIGEAAGVSGWRTFYTDNDFLLLSRSASTDHWGSYEGNAAFLTSTSLRDTTKLITFTGTNNGQTGAFRTNGVADGQYVSGFSNEKPQTVIGDNAGAQQNHPGFIAELIVFDRVLNADEIADVEDYLSDKWLPQTPPPPPPPPPLSLPVPDGVVLWLDASDKSTLLDGDGDSLLTGTGGAGNGFGGGVRTWANKSHAGNDAVQTAASARPTAVIDDANHNGLTVLKFDGFDDEFLLNQHINNTDTTIFAVIGETAGFSGWRTFYTDNDFLLLSRSATNDRWGSYDGNSQELTSMSLRDTTKLITFTGTNNGQTGAFRTNGVADGQFNTGFSNNKPQTVIGDNSGAQQNHPGFIAELIVFDRVLNADEIASVETYLNYKWFGDATAGADLGTVPGDVTDEAALVNEPDSLYSVFSHDWPL